MSPLPRIVVTQLPAAGASGGALPVGVVFWGKAMSVVVKLTFEYDSARSEAPARLSDKQESFCRATSSERPGALPSEYDRPSDLLPFKAAADVLLVGHAPRTAKGEVASFAAGDVERRFVVTGTEAERTPLTGELVRAPDGEGTIAPLGPSGPWPYQPLAVRRRDGFAPPLMDGPLMDGAPMEDGLATPPTGAGLPKPVQFAPPQQQSDYLPPGLEVSLRGLGEPAQSIRLPPLAPFVAATGRDERRYRVRMVCDTLLIDIDEHRLTTTWRGVLPFGEHNAPRHMLVALEPIEAWPPLSEVLAEAGRGVHSLAVDARDLLPDAPQRALRDEELLAARYEALEMAGEPSLSLERYAHISAELAEARRPRAEVLAEHQLDEVSFLREERAWLEQIGRQAAAGDQALALQYGELLAAAQKQLASPDEERRSWRDYNVMKAQMEQRGAQPVLSAHGLSVPAWIRLERRVRAQAAGDKELAEQMRQDMILQRELLSEDDEQDPAQEPAAEPSASAVEASEGG